MMDTNPFAAPQPSEPRNRGFLRTRIGWFLAGFALSWFTWSTIQYYRSRPVDLTTTYSDELRDEAPDWMKHAEGRKLGQFVAYFPPDDSTEASLLMFQSTGRVGVSFIDEDADGWVDTITVLEAHGRSVCVDIEGANDSFGVFSFTNDDDVTFADLNLDGRYDLRMGHELDVAVWIDDQWHDLRVESEGRYIEIDGKTVAVDVVDGVYAILDKQ